MTHNPNAQPQTIVQLVEGRKNLPLAVVLTLIFGPLGLLYVSVMWGLIMCALTFVISIFTLGFGGLIMWPIAVIMSLVLASSHNSALQRKMERAASR